jgi:hypothetical protein
MSEKATAYSRTRVKLRSANRVYLEYIAEKVQIMRTEFPSWPGVGYCNRSRCIPWSQELFRTAARQRDSLTAITHIYSKCPPRYTKRGTYRTYCGYCGKIRMDWPIMCLRGRIPGVATTGGALELETKINKDATCFARLCFCFLHGSITEVRGKFGSQPRQHKLSRPPIRHTDQC